MDPSGLSNQLRTISEHVQLYAGHCVSTERNQLFEPEASAFHDEMQGRRSTPELRAQSENIFCEYDEEIQQNSVF